jgi:hypothetical protein
MANAIGQDGTTAAEGMASEQAKLFSGISNVGGIQMYHILARSQLCPTKTQTHGNKHRLVTP